MYEFSASSGADGATGDQAFGSDFIISYGDGSIGGVGVPPVAVYVAGGVVAVLLLALSLGRR